MSCTIRQVTTDEARAFWLQQADARIFLHPDVLEPMCQRVDWWLASWNTHPVCLWPVCQSFDGSHRPPELSAYVGPLWDDEVGRQKAHRWWTISSGVHDAMIAFLAGRYGDFQFELPPGTQEIRPVQWFQGEHADSYRVLIQPRHTTFMDRPAQIDPGSIAAVFGRDRKRDVRVAMDHPYVECDDASAEEICGLFVGLLGGKAQAEVARAAMDLERARQAAARLHPPARATPASANALGALAAAEGVLGGALGRLMVVAEAYPELKADATMQSLSEELTSTENRLGFARQAYNDQALEFNDKAAQFPDLIVARLLGFPTVPMLESTRSEEERAAPKVRF